MADEGRIKFHEKILKYCSSQTEEARESDVNVNLIHFRDEVQVLKYDQATRDTQTVLNRVFQV
jgi:hypothetical protein